MRISSITAYHVRIPLKVVFAHAFQCRRATETILLVIESDEGQVGIGEVLPRPYLTGETLESVSRNEVPSLVQRWLGRTFQAPDEIVDALREELRVVGRALATFAGWELALLDLAGKEFRFASGDVLGPAMWPDLDTGVVIDFGILTQSLKEYCMRVRLAGLRHVKIKVGLEDDLCRLAIAHDVLGADHPLRLDANGAWSPEHAINMLRQMLRFNIRSVEQPVPAHDIAGMRRVREETGIAVVADESLCTMEDARRLTAAHAVDTFNIRIAKCGGFLACLQLVKLANELGLRCQLGTLVGETGILSRAAEIFGQRVEGFEFLEGKGQNKRLLTQDIIEPTVLGGNTTSTGLGITLASDRIGQWAASIPRVFKAPRGAQA